jgi:hypothetical protein
MERKSVTRLLECAQYLIGTETENFREYISEGNDPYSHIYSVAFIALHGEKAFKTDLGEWMLELKQEVENEKT